MITFVGEGAERSDGAVASIVASLDNTLYQDDLGALGNGSGQWMFAGVTAMERSRRAVLKFDVAGSVPAGSIITRASLRLTMDRGIAGPTFMTLHRVNGDWGEGASVAFGEQGAGGDALAGDATWVHRFFPGSGSSGATWATPGGDFNVSLSAIQLIGDVGAYAFENDVVGSGAAMIADVQSMLDTPSGNFGWLLLGDEVSVAPTAKRFWTREAPDAMNRPTLVIEYIVPGPGAGVVTAVGVAWISRRRARASAHTHPT